ncbi:chemotaxis protein CheB [Azospirillum sp. SYSU D00513]|uniref:chemotaxis protein CheB n=1 Tax=Azospirillum sp. SYSU D00513 TaxID=2812561 RepID=UPI0032B3A6F5
MGGHKAGLESDLDKRDIFVIGSSAGGVSAMQRLCAVLPASFPGALFLAQHVSAEARSVLPELLSRAGALPAFHPRDGDPIRPGHIHVAPPDRHMLLRGGQVLIRRGPQENRCRPAIDPLFRSAAVSHGARVVGVVLTGTLGDGTAGLRAVKACGGTAVVQDPADAEWPDMPRNALAKAEVDHCLSLPALADLLVRLAGEPAGPSPAVPESLRVEARISEMEPDTMNGPMPTVGRDSGMSCPECGGGLMEIQDGPLLRFRCHTGHAYSSHALSEEQISGLERAIYVALRTQNERFLLFEKLADNARTNGQTRTAAKWDAAAQEASEHVEVLRGALSIRRLLETEADEEGQPEHGVE